MPDDDFPKGDSPALGAALATLRERYGSQAVRAGAGRGAEGLPTGIGALDALTGQGGLCRGRLTWLAGEAGQGWFDLGLALLAHLSLSIPAVLVDFSGRVDPNDIEAYGGDLGNFWLVRPRRPEQGWAAARALAEAGAGMCLMVADRWEPAGRAAPATLIGALESGSGVGLICGGPSLPGEVASRVSMEIECRRLAWTRAHRDISGIWLRLQVGRSRMGGGGRSCRLRIALPRPYALRAGVVEADLEAGSRGVRMEASG